MASYYFLLGAVPCKDSADGSEERPSVFARGLHARHERGIIIMIRLLTVNTTDHKQNAETLTSIERMDTRHDVQRQRRRAEDCLT